MFLQKKTSGKLPLNTMKMKKHNHNNDSTKGQLKTRYAGSKQMLFQFSEKELEQNRKTIDQCHLLHCYQKCFSISLFLK